METPAFPADETEPTAQTLANPPVTPICPLAGETALDVFQPTLHSDAVSKNHYDAACEAYLRERTIPYVRVDETRRSLLEEASLKSPDFIVHPPAATNLVVDVKGRRFGDRSTWENWVTQDDVDSLLRWETAFGGEFRAAFLFAYEVVPRWQRRFTDLFDFRERRYAFFGVFVAEYREVMKRRSASWQTVDLPRAAFREIRLDLETLLAGKETSCAA